MMTYQSSELFWFVQPGSVMTAHRASRLGSKA